MAELRIAEQRFNLEPGSFPFNSHFASVGDTKLHYVDEGQGPTLVMLHGNPAWCFVYRHLIKELRQKFRCIALDLPGFGLSEAPPNFSFRAEDHALVLRQFFAKMDIRNATLIAHDWGGPIGLAAGLAEQRIVRLCLGNTWAWPVNGDLHFEWFSRLMSGPIGRYGTHRHAVFINRIMPASMKRRQLSSAEMAAYRAPFLQGRDRAPMIVFPREILAARLWLGEVERQVKAFTGPVGFVWPTSDIAFRKKELARWQLMFPKSTVTYLENCGHYLWEDAPAECFDAVSMFLAASAGRLEQ